MKIPQIFQLIFVLVAITIVYSSCEKSPTDSTEKIVEPEMISIDRNLRFTYGPSWDTTFVPPDSLPMLVVELTPYEIGKYEVTNEEYEAFVQDGGYKDATFWSEAGWVCKIREDWSLPVFWSNDKLWTDDPYSNKKNTPVHGISYYEAEAYCKWLSHKTNHNYHIPSSYQWVRAAKGPDPGTKYPWGNEYNRNVANYIPHEPDTVPLLEVFKFEAGKSFEGCYNMIGNVFEICLVHNYTNPQITFAGFYSTGILSAVSSGGDPYYSAMTTISGLSIQKEWRFYAIGLRLIKEK